MLFSFLSILFQILPHAKSGFTDECFTSTAVKDVCSDQGFCSTNKLGTVASCSCFQGYAGDSCEFNVKDLLCSQTDCGFSGIQGECVTSQLTNEASCYCYAGWDGEDCSINVEDTVDYCADITCNDRGECVEDLTADTNFACECVSGWGGVNCGLELPECGHEFLMDIFTRLAMISGDLESSAECGYSKPVIFSASKPAESDPFTYPYCICSAMLDTWSDEDYTVLTSTCNMDNHRKLDFKAEALAYCPGCGEIQDAVMEDVITTKSAACYHFVYQRAAMPLYWRSTWKCGCVMDVGNQATIETIVNCPFTQHTSSSDYISYENCGSDQICDWQSMYLYFENDYSKISLEGSVACKDWMEAWVFTVPGEQRFEAMDDSFCPCMDYLKGTGDDAILDCIPVTFHQLGMRELYEQICYDSLISNVECLNYFGYGSIELGVVNYTAASMCYAAVELGAGLDEMNDNMKTLTCDCIVPCYDDDFDMGDTIGDGMECLLVDFDISVADCPNYRFYVDPSETSFNEVSFDVSLSNSESTWKTLAIVEMPLCALLILSGLYLQKRKTKLNM